MLNTCLDLIKEIVVVVLYIKEKEHKMNAKKLNKLEKDIKTKEKELSIIEKRLEHFKHLV